MIEGTWANGKESGVIKEYDENGRLKVEKTFNNGKLDVSSVKIYEKPETTTNQPEKTEETKPVMIQTTHSNEKPGVISDGFHKTYTRFRKIDKEGTFKNGKLINGKDYIYDSDGNLLKINIYNNGTLVDIQYNE
jgi:antitoxin component YwqK of YwqJK toxin-antitoxin module